jgi:CheY-like chemotaxis protein
VQMALMDELSNWPLLLAASLPDAIVLDVSTATDHVWSVVRATMNHPTMQKIPLLFFSSSQESGSVLELDYLTKPVHWEELKQALDQQLCTPESEAPTRTVLIVDDDSNTLDMHARMIQSQYPEDQVLYARNGYEALEIMRSTTIHLILMDLMMPKMDGFTLLETMREQENLREIPVIVLTGKLLTETDVDRLNQGVARVLSKGLFNIEETYQHIHQVLERKFTLSGEARRLVRQAMAYIHEHYSEQISRQDIAQYIGLTEDHLTRCFRQELGIPPIVYLNRFRVNQAKRLLRDDGRSVREIALSVGFIDSGYFSRVFRREIGTSPEAFRHTKPLET